MSVILVPPSGPCSSARGALTAVWLRRPIWSGSGTNARNGHTSSGRSAPGHDRRQLAASSGFRDRNGRPSALRSGLPVTHRGRPASPFRRLSVDPLEMQKLFVRRDQPGAGRAFDRHVADRHAAFHAERGIASPAYSAHSRCRRRADLADDRQDDVLPVTPSGRRRRPRRACSWPFFWIRVCVASTCSLPRCLTVRQRAEAPWVEVWLCPPTAARWWLAGSDVKP